MVRAPGESALAEQLDDAGIVARLRREIEEAIACGAALLIEPIQHSAQLLIRFRVIELSLGVKEAAREGIPHGGVDRPPARERIDGFERLLAKRLIGEGAPRRADHRELGGERPAPRPNVQGLGPPAAPQIAPRAADDPYSRERRAVTAPSPRQ